MKRTVKRLIAIAFISLPIIVNAQDKLILVDSESTEWRKRSPQFLLFDKEMDRLLMPQAAFGVVCVPSNSPESALTYDSVLCALVYRKAENSIWSSTYRAMHKKKKNKKENSFSWVNLKKPKNYVAPSVKTNTLSITPDQAGMLRAIWKNAIGTAEYKENNMLDGIKWEYFIDDKRAKTHHSTNPLVQFTNELVKAVCTGDANRKDSLINMQFQRVVNGLTVAPAP